MTLTGNGKDYIANNFGISSCFVANGLTWTAVDINDVTASESGGSAQIVARLLTPLVYKEIQIVTPSAQAGTYTNAQLILANDNQNITLSDVSSEITGKDGSPVGEEQYCISAPPECVPSWQCETPLNGWEFDGCGNRRETSVCDPAEGVPKEYEFLPKPSGTPTAEMIFSKLAIKQSMSDYHLEMNKIILHNTSLFPIACALEIKIFKGSVPNCATTAMPVFRGVNRSTQTNPLTGETSPGNMRTHIIGIGAGAAVEVSTDYYQPETIIGLHTICLYLHAAWTTEDLEIEMLPIDSSELATYPW